MILARQRSARPRGGYWMPVDAVWYALAMTKRPPAITYRPDAELRARLTEYATRVRRPLTQAITVLLIDALDADARISERKVANG